MQQAPPNTFQLITSTATIEATSSSPRRPIKQPLISNWQTMPTGLGPKVARNSRQIHRTTIDKVTCSILLRRVDPH